MTVELSQQEATELFGMLKMMYTNHPLTKVLRDRLAGEPLIEFPPEPVPEEPAPVALWKEPTSAEIKALWNATKKPTEFAQLLLAKVKEQNT